MQLSNSEVAELHSALTLRLEELERRLASGDASIGEQRIRATESVVLCRALVWRLDRVMRGLVRWPEP